MPDHGTIAGMSALSPLLRRLAKAKDESLRVLRSAWCTHLLGVCGGGLTRVRAFGGEIENSAAGWQAYIDANPDAWRAPLFTAWRLHKRGAHGCSAVERDGFKAIHGRTPVGRMVAGEAGS